MSRKAHNETWMLGILARVSRKLMLIIVSPSQLHPGLNSVRHARINL